MLGRQGVAGGRHFRTASGIGRSELDAYLALVRGPKLGAVFSEATLPETETLSSALIDISGALQVL